MMKNLKMDYKLKVLVAGLLLVGCGKDFFQQNPLDAANENIKKSKPVIEKPDVQAPVQSDAVRIQGPEAISFKEKRADKFIFKPTLLMPDYEAKIIVENMDMFPGAKFDSNTGEFSWTPPKGYVSQNFYQELDLVLIAVAKSKISKDANVYSNKRSFHVFVNRDASVPQILRVDRNETSIREGSTGYFSVVVKDEDGGMDEETTPKLTILPSSSGVSLSSYVSLGNITADLVKKEWKFDLRVNLGSAELTDSISDADFILRATNRFGTYSPEYKVNYSVFTKLGSIETSWDPSFELTPGQNNSVSFLVYDTRNEGVINANLGSLSLPSGATVKCSSKKVGAPLNCFFNWNPPYNTRSQVFDWSFTTEMKNKNSADRTAVNGRHQLQVRVAYKEAPVNGPNPGPSPKPTPTPGPTPVPTATPNPKPSPAPTFQL